MKWTITVHYDHAFPLFIPLPLKCTKPNWFSLLWYFTSCTWLDNVATPNDFVTERKHSFIASLTIFRCINCILRRHITVALPWHIVSFTTNKISIVYIFPLHRNMKMHLFHPKSLHHQVSDFLILVSIYSTISWNNSPSSAYTLGAPCPSVVPPSSLSLATSPSTTCFFISNSQYCIYLY